MKGTVRDLGLTPLDDLFSTEAQRQEAKLPRIHDLPISEIDNFTDHPYEIREDEDMDALVESIRERGVITPIAVRTKEDGRYEIISGHRRRKACEIAGLETVKAEIREMTRDEAIILMVDSNVQRSNILPSEKARAYQMKLDAMNRQGQRTDLTSSPVGKKLNAYEQMAEENGDSRNQIHRYIRLNNLAPELLDMVDEGRIAMRPAVELSYLSQEEQEMLLTTIESEEATPSYAQSQKMRNLSKEGKLDMDGIFQIMTVQKGNQKERVSIQYERLKPFVPSSYTIRDTENFIMKAVEHYHKYLQRQRQRDMER